MVAWSLRAGPGNGDGGGTWADNATAERREAGLLVAREVSLPRKRGVARYCATYQGWTSLGAPPIPLARGSAATKEKRGRRRTRKQECAGAEETGLFDIVNRTWRGRRIGNVVLDAIASAATRSCPGRARASARLFARGAGSRARAGT